MEKTYLNDGLMAQMIEEAWKNLSGNYLWDESFLEKYKDKVDWGALIDRGCRGEIFGMAFSKS